MGAGGATHQENAEDLTDSYAIISKGIDMSTVLFRTPIEVTDHSTIDYDHIGIIFEYGEQYLVILKQSQDWKAEKENIISGWLDICQVCTRLISKCEFLPRFQIGSTVSPQIDAKRAGGHVTARLS
jgi:hypothetical protein